MYKNYTEILDFILEKISKEPNSKIVYSTMGNKFYNPFNDGIEKKYKIESYEFQYISE